MSLNIPQILTATISEARRLLSKNKYSGGVAHLDVGPGHGDLIKLLRNEGVFISSACDYTAELMKLNDVSVDIVDLNTQKLPYADCSFDLVTCTEVIEHIEHYREDLPRSCIAGVSIFSSPNRTIRHVPQ